MPPTIPIAPARAARRPRRPRPATCACAVLTVLAAGLVLVPAAAAATLTVQVTRMGQPLEDSTQGKFYVYEVGEREQYVGWGLAGRTVRVPDGTYDILVKYVNDRIERERLWEAVELRGSVTRTIDFDVPVARLTVAIYSGGVPIPPYTGSYSVHRAGQRGVPMASKRPGETLAIVPGVYDIEVTYRGPEGLKRTWLEGYALRGEQAETVDFGAAQARVTLTLTRDGQPLSGETARWRLYRAGERSLAVADAGSGETRSVPSGIYDVALFFRDEQTRDERWLTGVELSGEVDRRLEVARPGDTFRIDVVHAGSRLRDAWFAIYPVGDRHSPLVTGASGAALKIEPGTYDIGCFLRRGGLRAETWLESRTLSGSERLEVELEFEEASLRVRPKRRSRREADIEENVVLLVDSSEAMDRRVGSGTWLEHVRESLPTALDVFSGTRTNVGLRAFGIAPREKRDCRDSTRLVDVGRLDRGAVGQAVGLLRPAGMSAMAYALERAAGDLPPSANNAVVLITAGTDECGGDPCAAAAALVREGAVGRVEVLALGEGGRGGLDCVGGVHAVRSEVELRQTLIEVLRDVRRSGGEGVTVFTPGWGEIVVAGGLGERIVVAAGTYDVLVRAADESFRWPALELRGRMDGTPGRRPPR